ncbi:MAG: hypothetical protein R3D58_07025 [Saprospiraceae bacterium]|nr:hypothetical protein [Lewinellaceae bacterium]
MGLTDILEKLSNDGVRVEVAFEKDTIIRFMLFGCLAAIVAAIVTALIRKQIG